MKKSMMTEYTSPNAVLRAISDAAKRQSKTVAGNTNTIIEMEYRNRLLARVFTASDPGWVLKGGTSTLVRLSDARATKDIDLLRENRTLQTAVQELKELASENLGDFFRFSLLTTAPTLEGDGQGAREGAVLTFGTYCGLKKLNNVSVDLVVSPTSLIGAVEEMESPSAQLLPRLPQGTYRLYPLVDQIADKACAMVETYPSGQRSTRTKDLVDIVTYASTQEVESRLLRRAIVTEAQHRGLSSVDFANRIPAEEWASRYRTAASRVSYCDRHATIFDAVELVRDFIDGVVTNLSDTLIWNPQSLAWE